MMGDTDILRILADQDVATAIGLAIQATRHKERVFVNNPDYWRSDVFSVLEPAAILTDGPGALRAYLLNPLPPVIGSRFFCSSDNEWAVIKAAVLNAEYSQHQLFFIGSGAYQQRVTATKGLMTTNVIGFFYFDAQGQETAKPVAAGVTSLLETLLHSDPRIEKVVVCSDARQLRFVESMLSELGMGVANGKISEAR